MPLPLGGSLLGRSEVGSVATRTRGMSLHPAWQPTPRGPERRWQVSRRRRHRDSRARWKLSPGLSELRKSQEWTSDYFLSLGVTFLHSSGGKDSRVEKGKFHNHITIYTAVQLLAERGACGVCGLVPG